MGKTEKQFCENRQRVLEQPRTRASEQEGNPTAPRAPSARKLCALFFGFGVCYAHLAGGFSFFVFASRHASRSKATRNGALPPRQLATEARSNRTQIEQQ